MMKMIPKKVYVKHNYATRMKKEVTYQAAGRTSFFSWALSCWDRSFNKSLNSSSSCANRAISSSRRTFCFAAHSSSSFLRFSASSANLLSSAILAFLSSSSLASLSSSFSSFVFFGFLGPMISSFPVFFFANDQK